MTHEVNKLAEGNAVAARATSPAAAGGRRREGRLVQAQE